MSKKNTIEINQIQELINAKLKSMINMNDFIIHDDISMYSKNTSGIKCPNCKSENVYAMTVQLRSSDEASDRIYLCLDCDNKWKVSGSK